MKPSEILRKAAELVDTQHKTRVCFSCPDEDFRFADGACSAIEYAGGFFYNNIILAHKYFETRKPKNCYRDYWFGDPATCTDEQNAEVVKALNDSADQAERNGA